MKKMLILMLCIGLIPVLYANSDNAPQTLPDLKAPYRANFVMPEFPPTDQDTLWAQYPNPVTAIGMACQHDPAYPFDAWLLDDVIPPSADYVVEEVVSWWGNWNGFTTWTLVPEIYFQVYEDSGLAYAYPKIMPSQEVTVLQANFTATTIGTDQYLVEMTLPSAVTLPAGEISWVCVQPNNQFTLNGQTGWMGEVGIGNGQECYFAFPLLGNNKWTTATAVFGTPNEAGFALLGTEGGVGSTWDFETGWQGWTHTNGAVFPAAWDVKSSQYKAGSGYVCPAPGDSSMWIDSDAISGTWVQDTALSPVLWPLASMDWLVYGYCYNDVGTSDWFEVGIKYFDGDWNVVSLKTYTSDSYGRWDSVDVSAYAGYDFVQVYVYYDDANSWAWYVGFDNVSIDATVVTQNHDVGSLAFLSPGTLVAPGDHDVIGVVKNYGNFEETYDVHCVVTDPTLAVVLDETVSVTTPVGENDTINFGTLTFVDTYTYDLMMATLLSGDENPANDTLEQATLVQSYFWESWLNIDQGRSGAYAGFWNIDGQSLVYYWGGNPGPLATGFKYDGASWTSTASMPIASTYGGDMSFDGKVYLVGAWTGQNGLLSIFDCESETFSSVNLPIPIADPAIALYQDNYLYSIGGSNPPGWAGSTIVQVYDIGSDVWLTGVTQLPGASYVTNAEAGYIGNDSLIVSGGYDAGATNKTTMGAINPANPAEVTWSTGIPHPGAPAYRNFGGACHDDAGDYWFIVAGGSPYTDQTAIYQSNAGWMTAPNKITACSNCGATLGPWDTPADDDEIILYTIGGYTGAYLNVFEVFHTGVFTGIMERPDDNVTVFDFSATTTNPVKDQVRFTLSMPYQGEVSFQVFDVTGRKVIDTQYSSISRGEHTLFWNLKDEQHRNVAAGTYFYRFQAGEYTATGKLVVVR